MDLKIGEFVKGNGVEISKDKELENARHIYIEPDNFYSLREQCKPESLDFIYINNLDETKFYRIIIKEMLNYCKVGGYILVKKSDSGLLSRDKLKREIELCLAEKCEIEKEDDEIIIIKKTKPILEPDDSIDKWTFGIITNGKKNEWVEKQILAIKAQKIPNYEIIVCGTYFDREMKKFKYIFFNEKDELGWITKKKNLICEAAKYENLMILHDRIVLSKEWFSGMKKHGNYFEVLSCKIRDNDSQRRGDWMTYGTEFGKFPRMGLLDYNDWDKNVFLDGAMYILKKSVWKRVKWDESLFWNQAEDVKLSHDWYKAGIVPRFNKYSLCETLSWRHGQTLNYLFDNKKLSKYHGAWDIKDRIKFYTKKILKTIK